MELAWLVHRHHLPPRQEDHLHDAPDVVPHCLQLQVGLKGFDLFVYEKKGGGREGGREGGRDMGLQRGRGVRPASRGNRKKR